jgi:hypothetical protein
MCNIKPTIEMEQLSKVTEPTSIEMILMETLISKFKIKLQDYPNKLEE